MNLPPPVPIFCFSYCVKSSVCDFIYGLNCCTCTFYVWFLGEFVEETWENQTRDENMDQGMMVSRFPEILNI